MNVFSNFNDLLASSLHENSKLLNGLAKELDIDTAAYSSNPENILIEKERKYYEELFLEEFAKEINKEENTRKKEILDCYCEGVSITDIADKFNVDRKVVYRNIQYCKDIAKDIMIRLGIAEEDVNEFFIPPVSLRNTSHSIRAGFPMDTFINLPERGMWQNKYGSEMATTKKSVKCAIPEYLEQCGLNCTCCLCADRCTRSDKYPDNKYSKEFLSKHEKEIREVIKNIKEDMKNFDYSKLERRVRL